METLTSFWNVLAMMSPWLLAGFFLAGMASRRLSHLHAADGNRLHSCLVTRLRQCKKLTNRPCAYKFATFLRILSQ